MSNGAAAIQLPKLLVGISAPNTPVAGDGAAALELGALTVAATDLTLTLPAFTLEADGESGTTTDVAQSALKFKALTLAADGLTGSLGSAAMSLPVFTVDAYSVSFAELHLSAFTATGSGLTGAAGTTATELPALLLEGSGTVENLGQINRSLPAFVLVAEGDGGNVGTFDRSLQHLTLTSSGVGGADGAATLALGALTLAGNGHGPYLGTATLTLPTLQLIANGSGPATTVQEVLAINTNTAGLTSYSNFDFNSFATFNGVTLAAGDNGLYQLTGTLDDTDTIDTTVKLGIFDFGSDKVKRVQELFFNYRADGDLTVTVTLDDNEQYDYVLQETGMSGLFTNRLKLGKGAKARYWQVEVAGAGVDFEIDNMELTPLELSRRLA